MFYLLTDDNCDNYVIRLYIKRKEIVNILQNASPRDFVYSEITGQIYMLARLIKERYNVHYKSKTSYYIFFKEAKFTCHKFDKINLINNIKIGIKRSLMIGRKLIFI